MNTIKRDVYVLKNTIKIPIEVTKGTDAITFEFTVRDYNLPATAAAVAYAYRMGMKKPNSTLCDVSGNVISFQPSANFFEVGNNELQIRVINEDKSLISFKEKVKCSDSMGFPDEEEEADKSLIEQIIAQSGKESGERKAADEKERSERKTADETEKSERIAADAKEKSERQKEIATERARIDRLTKMGEGSTTGDAELADIRVGNEGATYSNAGNAVRAQTKDVPVMMDNLQSPYVDISLLEQGSINSAVGSEIASSKVLRSVEFHWNKNGKITAPAGYKIAIANYAMQPEESGQMTKVYMSFENYSDSQTSSKADGDAESRRLLIKRSDGANINAEDLRGKIATNVPELRAMDVIENLEKKIKTDTTSNELYKKEEREIAVDSSDYNLLENKVAYIDTNDEIATYENANAYVMHKNVISGEKYRILSQTHGSVNTLLYAICDSNGKVINSAKMGVLANTYITTEIAIPSNGVELYLNEFPTQTYPLVVNKIETINISKINGKETVNCWGDSLTRGVGVGDSYSKAFPYVLYGLLDGRKVINCGVGGENTINIASRQGGLPNIVKPFTIPADTNKVEIELTNIYGDSAGILLQGGSALDPITGKYVMTAQINPCSINGVEGTLTYENGKYYFSRSENGESVIVSRPTPLITYAMKSMRDNINIIWIGTNGGFTTSAELIECIEAMIDYMSPINKKYIVIGIHHLVSTVTETFEMIEKNMVMRFGRRYINQRKYIIEYGLSDAGITPTEQDLEDIKNDTIPKSLRSDIVHFNADGYAVLGKQVYLRGKELGYW